MKAEKEQAIHDLTKAIVKCVELKTTKLIAKRALKFGAHQIEIIKAISIGLNMVGDLYEKRKYFLMELIYAGSSALEIIRMIKSRLKVKGAPIKGKVIIGTVKGDIHNIGKDLVIALLESRGFEVIDLGVDVSKTMFLQSVKEFKPNIVAMSCILSNVVDEMRKIVDELERVGLRDYVKIMIGGRAVSSKIAAEIGADAYCSNAFEAAILATKWVGDR